MITTLLLNIADGPFDESKIIRQIAVNTSDASHRINHSIPFAVGQTFRLHSGYSDVEEDIITQYRIFKIDYDLGVEPHYTKLCINIYISPTYRK